MMKKKNRLFAAALASLVLSLSFTACGGESVSTENTAGDNATSEAAETTTAANGAEAAPEAVSGLKAPIAEGPVLLTTVGQSADVEMVNVLLDKCGIKPAMEKMATADDLGDANTLILAVGGSSKGLGAAGIDATTELDRVQKLVDAAEEKGLVIIALHIGGESRRGDLSDKFNAPSFEKADYAIVVADGNKDGAFTQLAADAGIPMDVVETMTDVVEPLTAAFK